LDHVESTDQAIDILLVDDEPRNLDALEVLLASPSYRLIRATKADDALRALLKHDVAAIVLDINMPDLTGVELAHIIKGIERYREIPILFLTAHLMAEQDIVAGYGAGAVDYLTKPVNPEVLRRKIGVFAELFRKTRELAELNATLETRVAERTAELARSEAALREADRQKDEFLATLAHELRNPLAPLRMGLDLLLRAGTPGSQRTLSIMNKQLDHMVRLIDDLLDVARISGGKLELHKQRISLASAIQTALDTCRPFFEKRQQQVGLDLDARIFADADLTRVAQIVGNLLHNASKFTPEHGQISLTMSYEEGAAQIRISDSGVGIAPEQLASVFNMFTRIEGGATVANRGLGIGLALSRRLAHMHGGELRATSPGAGQGSVFTLTLPAELAAPEPPRESQRPASLAPSGIGINLVIVEDNRDSAEVLALSLEGRGYLISVAHDGAQGLALVEKKQPHIVLCDIGLPDMSGLDVCKRVRELSLAQQPVMIALTGWGMEADVRRTQDAGFDHHLVKPVAPATLFQLLDAVAEKSRS
jgi:signal transduction histidine kinase